MTAILAPSLFPVAPARKAGKRTKLVIEPCWDHPGFRTWHWHWEDRDGETVGADGWAMTFAGAYEDATGDPWAREAARPKNGKPVKFTPQCGLLFARGGSKAWMLTGKEERQ